MNLRELDYSRHFLVVCDGNKFPQRAFEAACIFAKGFEKGLTLLVLGTATNEFRKQASEQTLLDNKQFIFAECEGSLQEVTDLTERTETPIVFFEIGRKGMFSNPMTLFKGLRELRIPFVLVKEGAPTIHFDRVLVPVCYLAEEKEKAPYTSNMARFLQSVPVILQAKDYGSKTPANVKSITSLYDKFDSKYEILQAEKDSFKVEKEAAQRALQENAGMVVISTSRDYGLDDLLFGPKELHVFNACPVPLMCINPRGDLYVLCW